MTPTFIVVKSKKSFPLDVPGVEVITAREYLTEARFVEMKRAKVFNLCRDQSYQTLGYYVSLLAEARAHSHIPSLATIQDLRQAAVIRIVSEELDALLQRSLHGLRSDEFELSIYFGRNLAGRYDRLCQALFTHFPAPLLRAKFQRQRGGPAHGDWRLTELKPISVTEVPESHHYFLVERAARYFDRARDRGPETTRYDLAILVNPDEADAPSDPKAINRFIKAAKQVGIRAFVIGRDEYARIGEYDALFIRETTGVTHHTYRFARRASKEGLIVIDDPASILKCCNKVYQAELFEKQGIPCPRTMIVHSGNRRSVAQALGLPCVLKRPDSSFSLGVVKANDAEELERFLEQFLDDSDLVVAQSYVQSDFDWRVGVLGGKALYVCRYFMAKGHWQIQKTENGGQRSFGRHETMAVESAPEEVVDLGVRAANAIGRGLYGVDIKEVEGRLLVMEVNDNPNLEAGVEDVILKDELYLRIMRHFLERLDERGRSLR